MSAQSRAQLIAAVALEGEHVQTAVPACIRAQQGSGARGAQLCLRRLGQEASTAVQPPVPIQRSINPKWALASVQRLKGVQVCDATGTDDAAAGISHRRPTLPVAT